MSSGDRIYPRNHAPPLAIFAPLQRDAHRAAALRSRRHDPLAAGQRATRVSARRG